MGALDIPVGLNSGPKVWTVLNMYQEGTFVRLFWIEKDAIKYANELTLETIELWDTDSLFDAHGHGYKTKSAWLKSDDLWEHCGEFTEFQDCIDISLEDVA